ncbi:MAG: hypothetical protein ACRDOH_32555 [Streptosporangiaceae bacterium]
MSALAQAKILNIAVLAVATRSIGLARHARLISSAQAPHARPSSAPAARTRA